MLFFLLYLSLTLVSTIFSNENNLVLQPIRCHENHNSVTLGKHSKNHSCDQISGFVTAPSRKKKNSPLHLISPIAVKTFVFCCIPRHSPVHFIRTKNFHGRCHFIVIIKSNLGTRDLCVKNVYVP